MIPVRAALVLAALCAVTAAPAQAEDPTCEVLLPTAKGPIQGTVLETTNAAGYTYLRLDLTPAGTWAAVPETVVSVGDCARMEGANRMVSFRSAALDRTFPEIWFGVLSNTQDSAKVDAAHGPATAAAPAAVSVEPSQDPQGRTVSEVHAQRAELAGQTAVVRGQVTKVTEGIMSRTWLHLVDGTGDDASGTHELIVTTRETGFSPGEIVEARGAVQLDLDLGFGYRYAVLLADATIQR